MIQYFNNVSICVSESQKDVIIIFIYINNFIKIFNIYLF